MLSFTSSPKQHYLEQQSVEGERGWKEGRKRWNAWNGEGFLLWELWTTNTIWLWCIWFLSTTLQCNALMIYIQILILNAGPKTVNCTVSVGRGCHNQTMIWCYRRQWCYNDVTDDRDLKTWTWLFDQCPLVGRPSFSRPDHISEKSNVEKGHQCHPVYLPSQYLVLVLNSLIHSRIQRQLGFKIIQWKHHWLLWSTFCVVSTPNDGQFLSTMEW